MGGLLCPFFPLNLHLPALRAFASSRLCVPPAPLTFAVRRLIVFVVLVYRATLRPVLGGQCRFTPSCSEYMLGAVDKHGPWRGGWMGLRRIGRCHPWGGSGYDPP